MITRRQEIFKFGQFDTVQVFFHCDWCKEETNVVEWFIKTVPKTDSIYTCPICSVKHITIKERL